MKNKSYINCYSIDTTKKGTFLNPGIPISFFEEKYGLTLSETPVCRYAVEEKFMSFDPTRKRRWLVASSNKTPKFYRYFDSDYSTADSFVYLLINYNYPEEMSTFLLNNAIVINEKNALIQLRRSSSQCFVFKEKSFRITANDVIMY